MGSMDEATRARDRHTSTETTTTTTSTNSRNLIKEIEERAITWREEGPSGRRGSRERTTLATTGLGLEESAEAEDDCHDRETTGGHFINHTDLSARPVSSTIRPSSILSRPLFSFSPTSSYRVSSLPFTSTRVTTLDGVQSLCGFGFWACSYEGFGASVRGRNGDEGRIWSLFGSGPNRPSHPPTPTPTPTPTGANTMPKLSVPYKNANDS